MDTLIKWAIVAAGFVAAMALVAFLWNRYVTGPAHDRGVAEGRAEAVKQLQPAIDTLTRDKRACEATNATIGTQLGSLQQDFATYKRERDDALARGAAELAREQARAQGAADNVKRLGAILAREKSAEPELTVCRRAYSILGDIINSTNGCADYQC